MFPVIEVPPDAANLPEQLGTKKKFWYQENQLLFKEGRPGSGEDWAEKIASELCGLLTIPHANYELGLWKGQRGVVSQTFVPQGGRLIHGNEVLAKIVQQYPAQKFFRVRQHTVRLVLSYLMSAELLHPPIEFEPFADVTTALDVFVGYLMLDAWIANQDRHHENWGLVLTKENIVHLAPSYDHASSLGRNESDKVRLERLITKDTKRGMEYYVERATSAFYPSQVSKKPLTTLEAFLDAARVRPRTALSWLKKLEGVSLDETRALFDQVVSDLISPVAIDFSQKMLQLNKNRLLDCVGALSA